MPFKSVFGLHFGNAINPNVKEVSETAKVQETWFLLKDSSTKVDLVNYHRQSRWLWFAINGLPQTAASRVATPPIVISKCRPLCGLHSPYKTFLRYFGINTMWYVQSHFVCAELSSCIFVSCILSEMRCYRFSTLPQETFSCLITIRVKRFAAP